MRHNPKITARKSQPWSAERAKRGMRFTLVGDGSGMGDVNCVDLRTGQRLLVSESEVYGATMNSFHALYGRAQSIVMRELLDAGAVLANSRGLFWKPRRKPAMRDVLKAA